MAAPLLRVVGLDLSLTSTGYSDGTTHGVSQTSPKTGLVEERLLMVVRDVMTFVMGRLSSHPRGVADLIVIEDGATSRTGPGHEELAALRLMVRCELWKWKIPFTMVRPNTLKRYTTGYGSAPKDSMVDVVDGRHGTRLGSVPKSHGRYDMADALALAAMGYDHIGQALVPVARPDLVEGTEDPTVAVLSDLALVLTPDRTALDIVDWPDLASD